jgi:soluble lytic murein transglycosylase
MTRRWLAIVAGFGLALAAPACAMAQTAADGALLAEALAEARAGNWDEAAAIAGRADGAVPEDIVLWTRLRDGLGDFDEFRDFLARNGDWPSQAVLRLRGEQAMPAGLPMTTVLDYFDGRIPGTGTGALRYAEALAGSGRGPQAEAEILRAWRELPMNAWEQSEILKGYRDVLDAHHAARLDMLLWRGDESRAEALVSLVDADWKALARARMGLRRAEPGVDGLIVKVPASLQSHPGLAYDRYLWRVGKGRWHEAGQWMLAHSTSAETLGRPDLWMERRANLAREALEHGDPRAAYRIAANSHGSEGADFAESEWVAGYIALTRLDDPELAIGHFTRFRDAVATPISLGRAGYWLGVAHERAGDATAAREAYGFGGQHQTSFYGQLAAARAGIAPDPRLAGQGRTPDWRSAAFRGSPVVQAAHLLHLADEDGLAMQFFRAAAENQHPRRRAALAQMAIDLGRPHIGVRIAKDAAAEGIILPDQYYPVTDLAFSEWSVPAEWAMAVARQESELNPSAVSPAGARGLMQLMPGTAQGVTRQLGIEYDEKRLVADPEFNARLGTTYLADMLERYRGSYVLATAAYNAGPARVDIWLDAYGDPRDPDTDPVQWIESIPYSETRNYVMRVLEGLHVYRARIGGRAEPIRLVADISNTG